MYEINRLSFCMFILGLCLGTFPSNPAYPQVDSAAGRQGAAGSQSGGPADGSNPNQPISEMLSQDADPKLKEAFEVIKPCFDENKCTHFGNMGVGRDPNASYGANCSCHKALKPLAIDIGSVKCNGEVWGPVAFPGQNHSKYLELLKCFAEKMKKDGPKVGNGVSMIYSPKEVERLGADFKDMVRGDEKGEHENHIHFMVPGCEAITRDQGRCKGSQESGPSDSSKKK